MLALVESGLFVVNSHIGYSLLGVLDIGGAIFIHAFGAFFGLAARDDEILLNCVYDCKSAFIRNFFKIVERQR